MTQRIECDPGEESSGADARDPLTARIIGCAIEVHRTIGPGLLEATYEEAMCVELSIANLKYAWQVAFPILYKGRAIGEYRLDLLVDDFRRSGPDLPTRHWQESGAADEF